MAIQMRRGQLADYDKNKMLAGEWGISIDANTENQKAFVAFAPGIDKEVLFVEDMELQLSELTKEATGEAEAWAHGNGFTANEFASGDGSTVAFELEDTPASIVKVTVDGVDVPSSGYTVADKTITFTDAPAAGTNNVYVKYTVSTVGDNAKSYKEQAEEAGAYWENEVEQTGIHWSGNIERNGITYSQMSEAWAIGERGGVPVSIGDQTYHNNSKWYASLSESAYRQCLSVVQDMEAYFALIKLIIGTVYINTEAGNILNTESGDRLILDY